MDAVPSISSSAQSLFQDGFSRLNRGAAKIVSSTLAASDAAGDPTHQAVPVSPDPFLGGILDISSAREEVGAAGVLLENYNHMMDDLMNAVAPYGPYDRHDRSGDGSFSTYA